MDILSNLRNANKERLDLKTFGHSLEDWSLTDYSNAVCGEAGELANVTKKIKRGDYTLEEANRAKLLADEAADVIIYLDILCQRAGVDLRKAIVSKFNQVSIEKGCPVMMEYPQRFF